MAQTFSPKPQQRVRRCNGHIHWFLQRIPNIRLQRTTNVINHTYVAIINYKRGLPSLSLQWDPPLWIWLHGIETWPLTATRRYDSACMLLPVYSGLCVCVYITRPPMFLSLTRTWAARSLEGRRMSERGLLSRGIRPCCSSSSRNRLISGAR